MGRTSLLKDLHDGTERWSIIVRVFRKWNVYQKASPSQLFCITMVLVDAEGNKIQASVIPKNQHDRFCRCICEGETYFIANFVVSENLSQYKATNHKFKIKFTQQTFVKAQDANIPLDAYNFFPIADILKSQERDFADTLIDVVAYVKSVGVLEEFRRDNETKNKLRMLLTDAEKNDIECVLFDECSTNAYMSQLQNMETPVVVVLNFVRIAFSDDGRPQVCSSYSATRVFFNPPIQEVKDMIARAKDDEEITTPTISLLQPYQSSQQSNSSILSNNNKILISQIPEQKSGQPFVIIGSVQKLETRHGWVYDGCGKCSSKIKGEAESFIYPGCKKKPLSIEPKIKLHYTVVDKSGVISVIFWDKLGVELLGKNAAELKTILKEERREYDFPDECDIVVGKTMMLKLKLNDFNYKHTCSSISVLQYTICEDLTNEFNGVFIEDGDQVESIADHVTQPSSAEATSEVESVMAGNMNPLPQSPVEASIVMKDVSLPEAVKDVPAGPTRGKRKTFSKRSVVATEATSVTKPSQPCAPIAVDERLLKVVKKEK